MREACNISHWKRWQLKFTIVNTSKMKNLKYIKPTYLTELNYFIEHNIIKRLWEPITHVHSNILSSK